MPWCRTASGDLCSPPSQPRRYVHNTDIILSDCSSSIMPDIQCGVAIVGPQISLRSITERLLTPPTPADGFVLDVSLVSDGGAFDTGDSIVVTGNQYTVTNLQVNSDLYGCLGAVRVRFMLLRDGELIYDQFSNEFLVTPSFFLFSYVWNEQNLVEARGIPSIQVAPCLLN